MLQSIEHEIALSELRTELRGLQSAPPADDATEEVRAAHDEKVTKGLQKLDDLETQKRTALKAEEVAVDRARRLSDVENVSEAATFRTSRLSFASSWASRPGVRSTGSSTGSTDTAVKGAEQEMRQALSIDRAWNVIPWPMLVEPARLQEIRQEQRAALAEGAKVRALIGREFAEKIGEGNDVFLRAAFGSGNTLHVDAGPDHSRRIRVHRPLPS